MRRIGDWRINWCWIAEIEDHQDSTCTILKYDRTKEPGDFEQGRVVEDGKRNVVGVKIEGDLRGTKQPEELKVRNVQHVFSYKGE